MRLIDADALTENKFKNDISYKAFVNLVKRQPTIEERKWIPCSERLPDKNGRYMCTNDMGDAYEVDWNAWINGEWLYPNENPVAWMPLPEAYEE